MLNITPRRPRWPGLPGRTICSRTGGLAILVGLLLLGLVLTGCSNSGEASEADGGTKDAAAAEKKSEKKDGEDGDDEKEEELPPVEVVNLGQGPIEAVRNWTHSDQYPSASPTR